MSQEKNQKFYLKLIIFYAALTAGLIFLLAKFGLSSAIKISELLQKKEGPESASLYENVLPAPQLYPLPEATNSSSLQIAGYSQPNQEVDLYLNDLMTKTFAVDSEGKFSDFINLSLGVNKIYAVTKDNRGIQSPLSQSWSVFYGNSPPNLEIIEPADKTLIKKQSNLTIKGKVEETSKVFINNHLVVVEKDGTFEFPITLQPAENKFKIVCTDPAQNQTQLDWTVFFEP